MYKASLISSCSYKVINESDVAAALSNSRKDGCYVAKWREKSNSSRKSAVVVQERVSLYRGPQIT